MSAGTKSASLFSRSSVRLRWALPGLTYFAAVTCALAADRVQLIDYKSNWKYEQPFVNAGTTWLEQDYADDQWQSGPGVFVWPKGENLLGLSSAETLLERDERKGKTWRFRFHFRLPYPVEGLQLTCTNLVDDNAILYINGKEAGRAGRFLGPDRRYVSWEISEDGPVVLNLPTDNLMNGDNVLAVELAQLGSPVSDAVFAMSLWAESIAPGPPKIINQPPNRSVADGDRVTFSAGVHGRNPMTFQWRKDGVKIPGAIGGTYTISSVDAESLGNYSCEVRNPYGSVVSSNATLSLAVTTLIPFSQRWRYDISGKTLEGQWRDLEYDDSRWSSGEGPLGSPLAAAAQTNFQLATVLPYSVPSTTYFRTIFDVTETAEDLELMLTAEVDDGAIFYLNGFEVARIGLRPGKIDFNTAGRRATRPGVADVLTIPTSRVVPGRNILAVEVHQSDHEFEQKDVLARVRLAARLPAPTSLELVGQPADVIVPEGAATNLNVEVRGARGVYQWFRNGVALTGANRSVYPIPKASSANAGVYHATITNVTGVLTTRSVQVTVSRDTNGPSILAADGETDAGEILVSYSERVDPETSKDVKNYKLLDAAGNALQVMRVLSASQTNVVISTDRRDPLTNYLLVVSGIRDGSAQANVMATERRLPVSRRLQLVALDDLWRVAVPDKAKAARQRDDHGWSEELADRPWKNARAPFASFPAQGALPVAAASVVAGSNVTTYFQCTFEFPADTHGVSLFLRYAIADGAIVYLNGNRILRFNMPAGQTTGQTRARRHVRELTLSEPVQLPAGLLRRGTNILAVELHTALGREPNLYFAAELTASIQSVAKGPVHITVPPADTKVQEGRTLRLQVEGVGASRWEWFQNGRLLPDISGENLEINPATIESDGTQFYVKASNQDHAATSPPAKITVIPDHEAPQLVSAIAFSNSISITFSEPVDLKSAKQLANYALTSASQPANSITNILTSSETQVLLSASNNVHQDDVLIVGGIRDRSRAGNTMKQPAKVVLGSDGKLISFASSWKYEQSGLGPDPGWRERDFDDHRWPAGPGLLGEEDTPLGEPIRTPLLCVTNGGAVTTYFRNSFYLSAKPLSDRLLLRYYVDDGALFYLNGHLVHAVGISASASFTNVSERIVLDTSREGPFEVPVEYLQAGTNVLAAEVHQASVQNGDIVFGAELAMRSRPYTIENADAHETAPEVQVGRLK